MSIGTCGSGVRRRPAAVVGIAAQAPYESIGGQQLTFGTPLVARCHSAGGEPTWFESGRL